MNQVTYYKHIQNKELYIMVDPDMNIVKENYLHQGWIESRFPGKLLPSFWVKLTEEEAFVELI